MHQTYFLAALRPRKCTPKQAHFQARKRPGKAADNVVSSRVAQTQTGPCRPVKRVLDWFYSSKSKYPIPGSQVMPIRSNLAAKRLFRTLSKNTASAPNCIAVCRMAGYHRVNSPTPSGVICMLAMSTQRSVSPLEMHA